MHTPSCGFICCGTKNSCAFTALPVLGNRWLTNSRKSCNNEANLYTKYMLKIIGPNYCLRVSWCLLGFLNWLATFMGLSYRENRSRSKDWLGFSNFIHYGGDNHQNINFDVYPSPPTELRSINEQFNSYNDSSCDRPSNSFRLSRIISVRVWKIRPQARTQLIIF